MKRDQRYGFTTFKVFFSLSLFLVPVMATDLYTSGSTSFDIECGYIDFFKVTVNNDSDSGGGPFDSENTTVELQPTSTMESGEIRPLAGEIRYTGGLETLRFFPSGSQKMSPQPGECIVDGQRVSCNLGLVPANQARTLRLYYIAEEIGRLDYQVNVSGPLFDPDPSNNHFTGSFQILPTNHRLVYPWISNREGLFESILVANNYSDQTVDVTLTARRSDGSAETVQRTIPTGGSLIEKASSLFQDLGSGNGYSVVLESTERKLTGHWVSNNLTTGTGRSPSQGIAIDNAHEVDPFGDRFGRTIMFGYLPITGDLTSAPVIVNLGNSPADVTLRFYDGMGNLVLEDSNTLKNLPPLRPFAAVANTLVPEGSGDLYLVASANQQLTGVAFVFNSQGEPAIGNVIGMPPQP